MSGSTDWAALMRAGLGRLRLAPDAFWALTPAELMLLLGAEGRATAGPMGRAALAALEAAYPDKAGERDG